MSHVYKCLNLDCTYGYHVGSIKEEKYIKRVMRVHTQNYIQNIFPF